MAINTDEIDALRRTAEREFELLANFSILHKYLTEGETDGAFWSDSPTDERGQPVFVPNDIRVVVSHKAREHQAAAALLTRMVQHRVIDMLPQIIRDLHDGLAREAMALVGRRRLAATLLEDLQKPIGALTGSPEAVTDVLRRENTHMNIQSQAMAGGAVSNAGLITPTDDEVKAFKSHETFKAVGDAPMDYAP